MAAVGLIVAYAQATGYLEVEHLTVDANNTHLVPIEGARGEHWWFGVALPVMLDIVAFVGNKLCIKGENPLTLDLGRTVVFRTGVMLSTLIGVNYDLMTLLSLALSANYYIWSLFHGHWQSHTKRGAAGLVLAGALGLHCLVAGRAITPRTKGGGGAPSIHGGPGFLSLVATHAAENTNWLREGVVTAGFTGFAGRVVVHGNRRERSLAPASPEEVAACLEVAGVEHKGFADFNPRQFGTFDTPIIKGKKIEPVHTCFRDRIELVVDKTRQQPVIEKKMGEKLACQNMDATYLQLSPDHICNFADAKPYSYIPGKRIEEWPVPKTPETTKTSMVRYCCDHCCPSRASL